MCLWYLLLSCVLIVTISPPLSATSQVATTPYLILMAKTLYQRSIHYIVPVYNRAEGSSYAIRVDSINPFTKEVKRGELTRQELAYKIPFENYPEESIRLNITIFSCTTAGECSRKVALESRLFSVIAAPSVNIIQIRRSCYHSGEVVQFRVIPYLSKRVAFLRGKYKAIYIEDPSTKRIKQWNDVSSLKAFQGLNFTLPQKAPFGAWRISLAINYDIDFEQFYVDDKPRPMFTVQLRQLKYLRLDAEFFTFKVCAKYPFVESMEASIEAYFCVVEYRHVSLSRLVKTQHCHKIIRGNSDIKNCLSFKESTRTLSLNSLLARYKTDNLLSLKTNLTVEVKQENGYSVRENITGEAGDKQMVLEVDSPSVYKPGLPYRGSLSVKDMDGEPVKDAEVMLLISSQHALNASFKLKNHYGTFPFGFFPKPSDTGSVQLQFKVVKSSKLSKNPKMRSPSVTKSLEPARSQLGGFMDIEIHECSRLSIKFSLRSTFLLDKNNIRAAVISERIFTSFFAHVGKYMILHVCEDTDDPILGHYTCEKGQQIRCLEGWHGDNCLTPVCQKGKCLPKSSRKSLENLTIFLGKEGLLDVVNSLHPNTQVVIWTTLTKNNITDVILARANLKNAEKCSPSPKLPKITLDSTSVEKNEPMVVSMAFDGILYVEKQNPRDLTCSLSVERECEIGCGRVVNYIDSSDRLNDLVEKYKTWCYHFKDTDVKDSLLEQNFDKAGFAVATNFPINRNRAHRVRRSADFRRKRSTQSSPPQLKPTFSETSSGTWNFHTFKGALKKLEIKAPSSPGKWKAQLMCITPLGIRISPPVVFSVKKVLHLEALLPVTFKEGKAHSVPISLFYRRKFCSSVKVEATASKNTRVTFKTLKGDVVENQFHWCNDRHNLLSILVEPRHPGAMRLSLKVTAISEQSPPVEDLIQRNVTIEAKGTTQVETVESLSCEGTPCLVPMVQTKVDKEKIVKGSEKIEIRLSGNAVNKITNLVSLIRAPGWQSEAVASILSVNVQLLEYYKVTGFKNENLLRRLRKYISEGCRRMLRFRKFDGSFANKENDNTTSTWFTTLVFANIWKCNRDSKELRPTLKFILSRQNKKSGCFEELSRMTSFSLAGGFRERHFNRHIITSFVLSNLKDVYDEGAFRGEIASTLQAGHKCLDSWQRHLNVRLLSTYDLSVVAEAMGKTNTSSSPALTKVFSELMRREQVTEGQRFWLTQNRWTSFWNVRLASDTETTARAVLAQLWVKKMTALSEVVPVLRWLVETRNDHRWYTFMDQTEALKALTAFAKFTNANGPYDPTIDVLAYTTSEKLEFKIRREFTKVNKDVIFQRVFAKNIKKLKCHRLGAGCVLITVRKYYNTL